MVWKLMLNILINPDRANARATKKKEIIMTTLERIRRPIPVHKEE